MACSYPELVWAFLAIQLMLVIALIGGIGAGKSTAAKIFSTLQVPIIDADQIAKSLVTPDSAVLQQIKMHFGEEIVDDNERLQRGKLRQIILHDMKARNWLENLLHPLIFAAIQETIKRYHTPYVIVEIPLANKIPEANFFDRILLIDAPIAVRCQRIMARDQISLNEAKKMISLQTSAKNLEKLATEIIQNNANQETLKAAIEHQHEIYLQLFRDKNPENT